MPRIVALTGVGSSSAAGDVSASRLRRGVRILAGARGLEAAVLLTRPQAVGGLVGGAHATPPAWVLRMLGGRLLVQCLVEIIRPAKAVVALGAVVDLTHAASMLAAARWLPNYRRPALASAAEAAASALASGAMANSW